MRQQAIVFRREQPRPKLESADRLLSKFLRRIYFGCPDLLMVANRKTSFSEHFAGVRLVSHLSFVGITCRIGLRDKVHSRIWRTKNKEPPDITHRSAPKHSPVLECVASRTCAFVCFQSLAAKNGRIPKPASVIDARNVLII